MCVCDELFHFILLNRWNHFQFLTELCTLIYEQTETSATNKGISWCNVLNTETATKKNNNNDIYFTCWYVDVDTCTFFLLISHLNSYKIIFSHDDYFDHSPLAAWLSLSLSVALSMSYTLKPFLLVDQQSFQFQKNSWNVCMFARSVCVQ